MKKSARVTLLTLLVSSLSILMVPEARGWRFDSFGARAELMAVDAAGDVIVAGRVSYGGEVFKLSGTTGQVIWRFNAPNNLSELPVSVLALDSKGDVFVVFDTVRGVTKLSGATGARIWAKPIGGSVACCQSRINSLTVDRDDNVITAGTTLVYSTYLVGNGFERGQSIAVDGTGNAYVTGRTTSDNFPRVTPFQSTLGGSEDVFERS